MDHRIEIRRLALALLAVAVLAQSAAAGFVPLKLMASDGAADDDFGRAVAVSGRIGLIGAPYDDDKGNFSGSAYLLDLYTGQELHKLTAGNGAADDWFSDDVAIRGNLALVGAPRHDIGGMNAVGSAYVYNVATGQQVQTLVAGDGAAEDQFGAAVALGSGRALVGAFRANGGARPDAGAAYLYSTTTWQQVAKLTASDGWDLDNFGTSLAISGNLAVIGADGHDGQGSNAGSAYLFNLATGQQVRELTGDDTAAEDYFGSAVAIDGNLALVGAFGNDATGLGSNAGAAYLFNVTTGEQLTKFTASDATADQRFGYSVAISGDLALIGAFYDSEVMYHAGAVYLFDVTTGRQIAKITTSDSGWADYFGYDVDLIGHRALVGAFLNDQRAQNAGAAYFYLVPEPAALVLLLVGGAALATVWARRPRVSGVPS